MLLTTARAVPSGGPILEGAARVLHVPQGPVPEASAAVRGGVGGRPVVALGGGRVIDSAKAIAGADRLLCAAVPTTLSGAELTPFHRMPAGVEHFRLVRPGLVVAEPGLMASQPSERLVASGMNSLAHAIEALYTPMANPVSELAALRAVELLGSSLEPQAPDRPAAALGALLAAYASGGAGFAVHHAVCQTLVRATGSAHAETNAVMLPHFAGAMASRAPREMEAVARALAVDGEPSAAAERLAQLASRAPASRLRELGVSRDQLPEVVAQSLAHPALGNTPSPPDAEELESILHGAW